MTSNFNSNSLASKVVDGIRNVLMNSGSCLHTNNNDGGDWWSVELSTLVDVYAVVITNRGMLSLTANKRTVIVTFRLLLLFSYIESYQSFSWTPRAPDN